MNRLIAERLIRNKMKKSLHEASSMDIRNYMHKIEKILNYRLGAFETGVLVEEIEILSETSETITFRVRYSVDVRFPTHEDGEGSLHYEENQEERVETMTFEKKELNERLSHEYDPIDQVEDRALEDLGPIKDLTYVTHRQGYDLYRCIAHKDGKGHWYAMKGDGEELFPITYAQAQGDEDIKPSGISDLRKKLGKMLLPTHMQEDLTLDDDPEETEQKYSSAATSINSSKLPALFNMVDFEEGSINLDYGGGRFDNVAEYLDKEYGATNLVYDKYNRSADHNREVLNQVRQNGGADTVTCSNVLNVIAEEDERLAVLRNCKRFLKSGGTCYITVYEGNGSGEGAETKAGYQMNRKTKDYESEIKRVFSSVTRRGKLFICN